jgi:RNA polymerase sigma-70 factor, ECF subfamily
MTDPLTDEHIMSRVMRGERASLENLVERYHRPLLGYLFRLTGGNLPLAEDFVQETFIRVLKQDSYQAGRPFKPWLYAIATHLAYDYFRSPAARRTACAGDEALADWPDPLPAPEEVAQTRNEGEQIAQALGQIGEVYRAALLLRFYQGLSLQEIAAALQIPLGTVKSRLSVGAGRLRGLLARLEKGEEE